MSDGLSIAVEEDDSDTFLLFLEGTMDESSAPDFKRALIECIEAHPERVVVDVTGVDSISSVAFGVPLHAARKARHRSLAIVCGAETARLLCLLGVDRVVALYASREAALAA